MSNDKESGYNPIMSLNDADYKKDPNAKSCSDMLKDAGIPIVDLNAINCSGCAELQENKSLKEQLSEEGGVNNRLALALKKAQEALTKAETVGLTELQKARLNDRRRDFPCVARWNEEGGYWESSCGLEWQCANEKTPKENNMNYCPKCGRNFLQNIAKGE